MFTERQIKILGILNQHRTGIAATDIARHCGVSSKTVRNDIKGLISVMSKRIATIHVSTRQGYTLELNDEAAINKLLEANDARLPEGTERTNYILRELLDAALRGEALKQQALADKMYIGLSTLKTSLRSVREILERYDLSIVNFKNFGMSLEGNERDMRHCIFTHLLQSVEGRRNVLTQPPVPIDFDKLRSIVIRVMSSYDIVLMDNSLERLLDYILITLTRAAHEHNVTYMLSESKVIEEHREFSMATAIFEEIFNVFGLDVLTNEIYYIAQHLIASKKYTPSESETSQQVQELTFKMLERVVQLVGIDFRRDEILRRGLKTHLEALIPRIRFRNRIHNEVLDVVKSEYPLAFQIGIIAGKVIEEVEGLAVSEDEIGFIAVHFGAALTRMNIQSDRRKQSAFLVCGSGIGTAILLKTKVEEFFKGLLTVKKVLPGYRLKSEELEHIDIIISTLPIDKLPPLDEENRKKIVVVRHFLDEDEVKSIQRMLFNTMKIFAQNVDRFFLRECFVTGRTFKSKEKVLNFMTGELKRLGLMDEAAIQSVMEREQASPTEIGNLVAIPHPLINRAAISSISVLILDRPILWVEHQVQVVFLLSIASTEFYLWEPIFIKLFRYLTRENGVKRIIDHPDYDTFIKDFKQSF